MEPTVTPPAPVPPPVVPAPVPAPPPLPPLPIPVATPVDSKYSAGGFLSQFDWVEIGFLTLGAFCLYCSINYYRQLNKTEREKQATISSLEDRTANIEKKLAAIGQRRPLY